MQMIRQNMELWQDMQLLLQIPGYFNILLPLQLPQVLIWMTHRTCYKWSIVLIVHHMHKLLKLRYKIYGTFFTKIQKIKLMWIPYLAAQCALLSKLMFLWFSERWGPYYWCFVSSMLLVKTPATPVVWERGHSFRWWPMVAAQVVTIQHGAVIQTGVSRHGDKTIPVVKW